MKVGLALIFATCCSVGYASGTTKALMQKKLAAAQAVFAGVVLGDYKSIKSNADLLVDISKASTWHNSKSEEFMYYAKSFQNAAKNIEAKADAKDRDGVALGYMRLTFSCTECHQHNR